MTFSIRAAERADADGIADVHVAAWRAGYAHVFPDSVLYADDFDSSRRSFWNAWRFNPGHRLAVCVEPTVGARGRCWGASGWSRVAARVEPEAPRACSGSHPPGTLAQAAAPD